jgi:hypothetical protein
MLLIFFLNTQYSRVLDVTHLPPSSADVKEIVELYHYSPSGPS